MRIYGVNIESVTVIVSVFIFGLGIGSIAGGIASKRFVKSLALVFALCEAGIGTFGFFSLNIFQWFAEETIFCSFPLLILYSFSLLVLPTALMGATLPVLVELLQQFDRRTGENVSNLYYCNTLGSGIASILVVILFYQLFALQGTIYLAVAFNYVIALSVMLIAHNAKTLRNT